MKDIATLAIYISSGSLIISFLGFANSIRQSINSRKNERLRIYDKVYHEVCDLLLHDYKKKQSEPYVSDDKALENAVNSFEYLHWLEQLYGPDKYEGIDFTTPEAKAEFSRKVSDEYNKYMRKKNFTPIKQSPVFYLEESEFRERFLRVMDHVKENLSYFSPMIRHEWEETTLITPEKVKNDYISLNRVYENSCEILDETVEDPFIKILFLIRAEHRELNKTSTDKISDNLFNLKLFFRKQFIKIKKIFKRKKDWDDIID